MKFRQLALCAAAMTLCVSGIRAADQPSGPAGHWEGAIQGVKTPQGPQDVPLTLDLARAADGNWTGSVDVGERVKGLQLTDITVNGPSVHMAVKDAPGGASFDGKLSPDGKTMSGDASQGPNSNTFKLTRTGEAHVAEAPRSSVISAQLEGQWKGQLEGPGQTLHLLLDIKKQPDGTGGGTLTSVDQNNSQIPLTELRQDGKTVIFTIKLIDGRFEGTLNDSGTAMTGHWTQGPNDLPLTWSKAENPAAAPPSK